MTGDHDTVHPQDDGVTWYVDHSTESAPGDQDQRLADLPDALPAIVDALQQLVVHRETLGLFGATLPVDRRNEAETRYVRDVLAVVAALDPRPLDQPRPPDRRFAGSCRDFALLVCSLLRRQGVPARVRCGFADYFEAERWEDHWVAEYHDVGTGWTLVDAELGPELRQASAIDFDPLDVPRHRFVVAGEAWRRCRAGEADPERFGVGVVGVEGLWFVRNNVLRDLAALNRREMLPWDEWGLASVPFGALTGDQLARLDEVAATEVDGGPLPLLRAHYQGDHGFRVPGSITSHTTYDGIRTVRLRDAVP